ncbi:MAG: fused MFS/spermidine synthase, partial [Gammaproteobacteria bacterium]
MELEASESAAPVVGRIAWYAIAIFLSSAGLMVLEIAAGRLLAPYIGVSLYSWTAI